VKRLIIFPLIFLLCACANKPNLTPDEVLTVQCRDNIEQIPDHYYTDLVEEISAAKWSRTGRSGPATHRLIVTCRDEAAYYLYRINEQVVEMSYRWQDVRKKYFLSSSSLAELVKKLGSRPFIHSDPIEIYRLEPEPL